MDLIGNGIDMSKKIVKKDHASLTTPADFTAPEILYDKLIEVIRDFV